MKKLIIVMLTTLLLIILTVTASAEAPVISADGASVRIPNNDVKGGLRFKVTVNLPLPEGIEIIDQGTLIVPLYIQGENELTLDSPKALKVAKTPNKYYSYTDAYYEYTAALTDIPVANLNTPICARGYLTYAENGETHTIYTNMVIHDIYSTSKRVMAADNETDATKKAVKEFTIDAFDAYVSAENSSDGISIISPAENEIVYPYIDKAKEYLEAGADANVSMFANQGAVQFYKGIRIEWSSALENVASYTVSYGTKADLSDAVHVWTSATENSTELFNLLKDSTYYLKVTANLKDGRARSVTSTFKTTDLGPRPIKIDGMYNVRDIGGYKTENGKTTLQGMLYRGGLVVYDGSVYNVDITDFGKHTFKELGIKSELDFRLTSPTGETESAVPGVVFTGINFSAYRFFSNQWRDLFEYLSDINNYPIYFHCQGGADRTGTLAYVINALLGVSETDLKRDYEFTSFSLYGHRTMTSTVYILNPKYGYYTQETDEGYEDTFLSHIDAQEGDTYSEKVENLLLGMGVTPEQIANVRSIMLTGTVARSITLPETVSKAFDTELTVGVSKDADMITKVTVGGTEVPFTVNEGSLTVAVSDITAESSETSVNVYFSDGGEAEGTFLYDGSPVVEAYKYFDFGFSDDYTLNSNVTKIVSEDIIGYDKWIKFELDAVNNANGDNKGYFDITIGSYKVVFHGKITRFHNSGGAMHGYLTGIDERTFAKGNDVYLYVNIATVSETEVKAMLKTVSKTTGEIVAEMEYTMPIAESVKDAYVTVMVGASYTSELTIGGSNTVVELSDYVNFGSSDTIVLNSDNKTLKSNDIGYGKWIRMHLEATNPTAGKGSIWVYLGRYGFAFYNNQTRFRINNSSTNYGIYTSMNQTSIEAGDNVYLYLKTDFVSDTEVKVSIVLTDIDTGVTVNRLTQIFERSSMESGVSPLLNITIDAASTSQLVIHKTQGE